jgi:two-component system, chemotaxis family, CheB/CheR fusion protein
MARSDYRPLKKKNGIAMAQEPSSAKFDSMPRHAIDSVNLDAVATPDKLPEKLFSILKNAPLIPAAFDMEKKDKSALEEIVHLLKDTDRQ